METHINRKVQLLVNCICYADDVSTTTDTPSRQEQLLRSTIGGDISFLLARASAVSLSAANTALREHGLKVRSYSVLALAADDLSPTQKEIADFLQLDPSQVVTLVDELERGGFVERTPGTVDRRSKVVTATEAGVRLHADVRAAVVRAEAAVLAHLTPAQRTALAETLRHVGFAAE